MPILKDFRITKEVSLPSFPDSKIVIYDSLLVGDIGGIDYKNSNELQQSIETLPLFIKSWNFTDEEDKELPISRESLGFLKIADLQFLGEAIMSFTEDSKKKPSISQE